MGNLEQKVLIIMLFFASTAAAQKTDPVIYSRTILWEMYPNLTMKDALTDQGGKCIYRKEGELFTGYSYDQTNRKTFEIERYKDGKFTGHSFGFMDGKDTLTYQLMHEQWPTDTNRFVINRRTYFKNGQLKENGFEHFVLCEHAHHEHMTIHSVAPEANFPNQTYYISGQLRVNSTGNVRQNGSITFYDEQGNIMSSRTYKDGQPTGLWERYEADGTCSGKLVFKKGKPKRGFWSFENGVKIKAKALRKQGRKIL